MPAFKTIEEVKQQVNNGKTVYWKNSRYTVKKYVDNFMVWDKYNGFCGGYIDNDCPTDFYVLPDNLIV